MAQQKSVLGKGLASLLPGAAAPPAVVFNRGDLDAASAAVPVFSNAPVESNRDRHPGINIAALDEIQVNPYQPRREFNETEILELAQSIEANGIIQPLIVRKAPQGNGYQLIAGERRLRAARVAGLKQVPIVIRKTTDRESLEIAIVENVQREDLNCIDEALAYFQLMQEFQITQEEVAQRVGKERVTVANHLRLLRLPEAIIDDLKKGFISFGHGKALLSLDDQDQKLRIRAAIVEKKLSVRQTEQLVELAKKGEGEVETNAAKIVPQSAVQLRLTQISQDLSRGLSTKVVLKGNGKKGKIQVHYHSQAEFERLVALLQGQRT